LRPSPLGDRNLSDVIHDIHPLDDFFGNGMLSGKPERIGQVDEKLRALGV